MLPILNPESTASLLADAAGPVSYRSDANYFGVKTTAIVSNGSWTRKMFASDYMREAFPPITLTAPTVPAPQGKLAEPYNGPFPRGKHSHRCATCGDAVACYKAQCRMPQRVHQCRWC